jgi:DNA-binding transcriptional ArsR family regulator
VDSSGPGWWPSARSFIVVVIRLEVLGVRPGAVRARVDAAAELMACLHVLAEPEHHPERAGWTREVRGGLSPATGAELERFGPLWSRFRTRLLLPLSATAGGDLDEALEQIAALADPAFIALCAEAIHGISEQRDWTLEDSGRAKEFVHQCYERSTARGALAAELVADPQRLRTRLLALLSGLDAGFFAALWRRVRPELARTAAIIEESLRTRPLALVIGSLAPTAQIDQAEQTVTFEKLQQATIPVADRELVLIPTRFGHPHLLVKGERLPGPRLPVVVQFPMRQADSGSLDEVRDRLLALTDETRLALCRHLINERCTTTELARRSGMSVPQVSRHLRRLRETGLVVSERQGRTVQYRIVLSRLYGLGYELVTRIVH